MVQQSQNFGRNIDQQMAVVAEEVEKVSCKCKRNNYTNRSCNTNNCDQRKYSLLKQLQLLKLKQK